MNISIEQANKLLAALAGNVVVVADEQQADSDVDTDALITTVNENISVTLRPSLEEQMKPLIEGNYLGRFTGTMRAAMYRIFSIPRKELDSLNIEQMVAKCKQMVDVQILQNENERRQAAETAINGYEEQLQQIKDNYETMLAAERGKQVQKDIAARCMSLLERLPRKGGDITEQAEMLRYKMQLAYDIRYNESDKRLEFYKEDKLVFMDSNQPLSDESFARMWAEKAGILVNDTRHVSPADVKAGHNSGYGSGVIVAQPSAGGAMEAIVAWAEQ